MDDQNINSNVNPDEADKAEENVNAEDAEFGTQPKGIYGEEVTEEDEQLPDEEEVEPIKEKPAKPVLTPEERRKHIIKEIWGWIVALVCAVAVVFVLRNWLAYPITVDGSSMNPTLQDGDVLLATAYDVNIVNNLQRGDVVICNYPGRTSKHPILKFLTVKTDFVKRIVGVPGDTVKRVSGVTYVNDVALDASAQVSYSATYTKDADGTLHYFYNGTELTRVVSEDGTVRFSTGSGYAISESSLTSRYKFDYEYVLGDNEYFVVGDNRYNSHDSRAWSGPDLPYNQTNSSSGDVGPITKDMIVGHVRSVVWPFSRWGSVANNAEYVDSRDAQ